MTNALEQLQDHFASALLDPNRPVPGAVTSHTSRTPQKRFAVYRNNVVAGLIEALRAQFPASERIVGEEFFAGMARVYIETQPPRSPILVTYGDGFPDFIAGFAPAADVPYLADVARLEAARVRAYHAADAVPLDPARWQEIDPQALASLHVALHPSVEIVRFSPSGRHDLGDERRRSRTGGRSKTGPAKTPSSRVRISTSPYANCRLAARRFYRLWLTAPRSAMPRKPPPATILNLISPSTSPD